MNNGDSSNIENYDVVLCRSLLFIVFIVRMGHPNLTFQQQYKKEESGKEM